ncbi:MAG: Cd(II)/Pb(II)-responsive transcriptional regulator [Burkholderiaceae bacterium]|jgi:Cd(II)/Pb(II)-responsive transcriptional regulator
MKIGDLARQVGCPVETLRFWEKEGLLPEPQRSQGNYRLYGPRHLQHARFIHNCRTLDMSLEEIRRLLALQAAPGESCEAVNALVDEHIRHVTDRIASLRSLEHQLRELRRRCTEGREAALCGIIEGLSNTELASGGTAAGVHGTHRHHGA